MGSVVAPEKQVEVKFVSDENSVQGQTLWMSFQKDNSPASSTSAARHLNEHSKLSESKAC